MIFMRGSQEAMEERCLERGKTSGRSDDNIDTIKRRCVYPFRWLEIA